MDTDELRKGPLEFYKAGKRNEPIDLKKRFY